MKQSVKQKRNKKTIIKHLYLSGAISNDKGHKKKFKEAAKKLREKGFEVTNPVEFGHIDLNGARLKSKEHHLMRDICLILGRGIIADACQGLAVIPHKDIESWGADLEKKVAKKFCLPIKNVDKWLSWEGDDSSIPIWKK